MFYLMYRHNIKDSGMYSMNECLDHIMHTDGVQRAYASQVLSEFSMHVWMLHTATHPSKKEQLRIK